MDDAARSELWALSVWEPWTYAICELPEPRAKRVENRYWPPYPWIRRRRWIALHSAQTLDDEEARILVAKRGGIAPPSYESEEMRARRGKIHALVRIDGSRAPGDETGDEGNPWRALDQHGWEIGAVIKLAIPVEVRGAQKVWRVPVPAAKRVIEQVAPMIVAQLARPGV